jgi:hypothetical protein
MIDMWQNRISHGHQTACVEARFIKNQGQHAGDSGVTDFVRENSLFSIGI